MPWVVTLTILVASAFLMDMSFTMITPFLPVYLSSALGAKASEVDMWSGAVFAVTFFVSGLLGPVWGVLADRKSRKLMALRASIGLTIITHCAALSKLRCNCLPLGFSKVCVPVYILLCWLC
ncbi:MAG: MFS transporter [Parasutterella sp.]